MGFLVTEKILFPKTLIGVVFISGLDFLLLENPTYRMSEKSVIDYMERRIRGEKVKFPDDYFPFGI